MERKKIGIKFCAIQRFGENVFLKNESTRNAPFIQPFLPVMKKKSNTNFKEGIVLSYDIKSDFWIYIAKDMKNLEGKVSKIILMGICRNVKSSAKVEALLDLTLSFRDLCCCKNHCVVCPKF